MTLSCCKRCRTPYTGLRCPNCGQLLPAVGATLILIPMTVGLPLLAWAIPDETIPRAMADHGTTHYVFQSFRTAVLWPAGATLLLLILMFLPDIFKTSRPSAVPTGDAGRSDFFRILGVGGRGILRAVRFLCFGMLTLLFFNVILIDPLLRFRQVDVSDSTVVCKSLFRTRSLRLNEISSAHMEREYVSRKGTDYMDCAVIIEGPSDLLHSTEISLPLSSQDLPRFTDTMQRCVTDINCRKKAGKAVVFCQPEAVGYQR